MNGRKPPVSFALFVLLLITLVYPGASFAAKDPAEACNPICAALAPVDKAQAAKAKALDHTQVKQLQQYLSTLNLTTAPEQVRVLEVEVNAAVAKEHGAKARYTITTIPVWGKEGHHGSIAVVDDGASPVVFAIAPDGVPYVVADGNVKRVATADLNALLPMPFHELPAPANVDLSETVVVDGAGAGKSEPNAIAQTLSKSVMATHHKNSTIGTWLYDYNQTKLWSYEWSSTYGLWRFVGAPTMVTSFQSQVTWELVTINGASQWRSYPTYSVYVETIPQADSWSCAVSSLPTIYQFPYAYCHSSKRQATIVTTRGSAYVDTSFVQVEAHNNGTYTYTTPPSY
jgi:hypothetical protein